MSETKFITPPRDDSMLARWWQRVCELLNHTIYDNVSDQYITTPLSIGDGEGNQTTIEADGSLLFEGDASVYLDELGALTGQRLESPSSDIVLNIPEAAVTFETSARYPADYVVMPVQINHFWKEGSVVFPHLHWNQTTADTPNWLLGYRWQINGSAKTTAWTNLAHTTSVFTYVSGTLNQITPFANITPPVGFSPVSDILQLRLYRDYTNVSTLFAGTDPVGADVDAMSFDIHVQIDTVGSRGQYTK